MHRGIAGFAIGLVTVMAGCGAARPSKYYVIEPPGVSPVQSAAGSSPLPVVLLVGGLTASHLYRDDRIVYSTGANQLGTYQYERWAEPPTEMLEAVLVRMLRASGRFASVQTLRSSARGDYILRGRLQDFEEISGSPLGARVAFELELYELKSGTVVWSQFYSHDEPVDGKSVPAVVQGLDRNLRRGFEQVLTGLDQYFSSHPPR